MARQIIWYSVALVVTSFVFGVVDHSGLDLLGGSRLLPAVFTWQMPFRLRREKGTPKSAMRLFTYSITYVTVVFVAMALDVVVRYH